MKKKKYVSRRRPEKVQRGSQKKSRRVHNQATLLKREPKSQQRGCEISVRVAKSGNRQKEGEGCWGKHS